MVSFGIMMTGIDPILFSVIYKKIISLILAILTALSLAACANPQPVGDAAAPQGTSSPAGSASEPNETVTEAEADPPRTSRMKHPCVCSSTPRPRATCRPISP